MIMAGMCSCEKYILYTDLEPEPLLVMNGLQQVGQPARLVLEKTSFGLAYETDLRVKDVKADLYVNGVFKESMRVIDSGYYETYESWETGELYQELKYAYTYCESDYVLQEGDALRFEVSSSDFEEVAEAETTMPSEPAVISFDTVRVEFDENEMSLKVYLALKIDDPAGENYYNIYPQGALDGFTSGDPVFSDLTNVIHVDDLFGQSEYYGRGRFNVFDDVYFDGQEYSVTMQSRFWDDAIYEPFILEISCVDDCLYKYQKSYNDYSFADGGLLEFVTEPAQVYSNVKNGVGTVAAQSLPITLTVDLTNVQFNK